MALLGNVLVVVFLVLKENFFFGMTWEVIISKVCLRSEMDLSEARSSYDGKKYEFWATRFSSSEIESEIFSRSDLGSADWGMRERDDSMESLELENLERKDCVDSKVASVLLDLEPELRDSWRRERRSSIAECLRSMAGSRVSKSLVAVVVELDSPSIP